MEIYEEVRLLLKQNSLKKPWSEMHWRLEEITLIYFFLD